MPDISLYRPRGYVSGNYASLLLALSRRQESSVVCRVTKKGNGVMPSQFWKDSIVRFVTFGMLFQWNSKFPTHTLWSSLLWYRSCHRSQANSAFHLFGVGKWVVIHVILWITEVETIRDHGRPWLGVLLFNPCVRPYPTAYRLHVRPNLWRTALLQPQLPLTALYKCYAFNFTFTTRTCRRLFAPGAYTGRVMGCQNTPLRSQQHPVTPSAEV